MPSKKLFWQLILLSFLYYLSFIATIVINLFFGGFGDDKAMGSILAERVNITVVLQVVGFFLLLLFLTLLLGLHSYFTTNSLRSFVKLNNNTAASFAIVHFCASIFILHYLNKIYYPHSVYSQMFSGSYWPLVFYGCVILLLCFSGFTAYTALKTAVNSPPGLIMMVVICGVIVYGFWPAPTPKLQLSDKPNIIFIGVDSLRPDYLAHVSPERNYMPFLNEQLQHATIFRRAYTPLARTFPAWMSILSGKNPIHHGARFNLPDRGTLMPAAGLLSSILSSHGYHTVYATDERRFSNIDTDLGFDQVIGPMTGALDFILGMTLDFPIANLLHNFRVGRYLTPFTYANRASAVTYKPKVFNPVIFNELRPDSDKSLFLAVHYCLPHWPLAWADSPEGDNQVADGAYKVALSAVDDQIREMFTYLHNIGALKNSIVVFLSDHGESFGLQGDMPDSGVAIGHGTHVLSLTQYHVLLSFSFFKDDQPVKHIEIQDQLSSLMDIKPTILDLLHLKSEDGVDGMSLASWINRESGSLVDRRLFLETGFSLPDIETVEPNVHKLFVQGASFYDLGSDGRLTINAESAGMIIRNKELAVLDGSYLAAALPVSGGEHTRILVNMITNSVVSETQYPDNAPLLFSALEEHFLEGAIEHDIKTPAKSP